MIADAREHLIATMEPGSGTWLWPPSRVGTKTDPLNVQHGAAGVLAVLVRAYRAEPAPATREAIAVTSDWIRRRIVRETQVLPGLHFGRSGTAWALHDAGTLLDDRELTALAVDLAQRIPLRWPNPDVCHGMAGAGLAQLRFWEATGEEVFLDRAREVAAAVARAAEHRDGVTVWPIPRDFPSSLAGLVHYGFAHGVAGVASFLLAAGRASGDGEHLELAAAAARTLRAVARIDEVGARWASSAKGGQYLTHWCSGSSGIGTFLIRQWRHDGDGRWEELLDQAARAVHRTRWQVGSAQCHGLAGDAEFLLDLAEASGNDRYRDWAAELAATSYAPHAVRDGRMVVPDDTQGAVVADFSAGMAGVLAFLLRLRGGGPRIWLPESFARLARPAAADRPDRTSARTPDGPTAAAVHGPRQIPPRRVGAAGRARNS